MPRTVLSCPFYGVPPFWRHGYEGVSVADLAGAIGVAPPSLYQAFGNKADLFRAAVNRYEAGASHLDPARFAGAATAREAVRALLDASILAVTDPARERGCLISDGLLTCSAAHADLAAHMTCRRDAHRAAIASLLRRWLDPAAASVLARAVAALLQGVSVQARDGATADELRAVAAQALQRLTSGTLSTDASPRAAMATT